MPKERINDVIFDPSDLSRPLGLNMLELLPTTWSSSLSLVNLAIFDKLYDLKTTGGPMFELYRAMPFAAYRRFRK